MSEPREVLGRAMRESGTTQSYLARISGVRQPTISQMLSGKVGISDDQLGRLLACMGQKLEVVRRAVPADLTRSEWNSWRLHRQLAGHLDAATLEKWMPRIRQNLARLRDGVRGEPHVRNVREWEDLVADKDVPGLHRVLTGLGRHSIEMREVSPMAGLLDESERLLALAAVR